MPRKSSGLLFASLPLHVQKLVLKADADAQRKAGVNVANPLISATPNLDRIIRQSTQKLNKLEARFLEWLQAYYPGDQILTQSIQLKLANGVRYTPDFVVIVKAPDNSSITYQWFAYETKGFMREDAAVKIKVAAKEYPAIVFELAWWDKKTHDWKFQEVLS